MVSKLAIFQGLRIGRRFCKGLIFPLDPGPCFVSEWKEWRIIFSFFCFRFLVFLAFLVFLVFLALPVFLCAKVIFVIVVDFVIFAVFAYLCCPCCRCAWSVGCLCPFPSSHLSFVVSFSCFGCSVVVQDKVILNLFPKRLLTSLCTNGRSSIGRKEGSSRVSH